MKGIALGIGGCVLLLVATLPVLSQTSSFRLRTADSLFTAKRYVQSLEHYEKILEQQQYTPAMLLKMAFIEEGLQRTGSAMYYLNLYYSATKDKSALDKMEELAAKYNLEGYEAETAGFRSFYYEFQWRIRLALVALVFLFFSIAFYTRVRLKRRPVIAFSFLTLMVLLFCGNLYYSQEIPEGIITAPQTYVMSAPSAAANVVEIVGDGHKVQVTGKRDVWLRIMWGGNYAYIRESTLRPISL